MYIPKVRYDLKSSNFHQGADTDLTGEQHYEHSGDKNGDNKGLSCFRCDRVGHLTRSCTYDKQENGDNVSTKEEINTKYEERAEAKKTRWGGKAGSGKNVGSPERWRKGTNKFLRRKKNGRLQSDEVEKHITVRSGL